MRAELLGQIVGAQFELERAIAGLTRSGASAGPAQNQLQVLATLQRQIGDAGGPALASLRAEIATTVAESRAIIQQSTNAARGAEAAEIETLATASAAARATAQAFMHDFYERKIFDSYLRFSSVEDEAEYRKREDAYRRAIDAALAKGTPEGDAEAMRLSKAQLADAGAHGADRSPEFATRWQQMDQQETALARAISAAAPKASNTLDPPLSSTATVPTDADMDKALATLQSIGAAPLASSEQTGPGLAKGVLAINSQRGRVDRG